MNIPIPDQTLVEPIEAAPLVVISYSHKDEEWKERLRPHLAVLERQGRISIWDDRNIDAGTEWNQEIMEAMRHARVAICLISADYLSSPFCTEQEIPLLLERQEQGELVVIPVLLRPCDWKDYPWLEKLQMLPRDGKSVVDDFPDRWDKIFSDVANRVRTAVYGSPLQTIVCRVKERRVLGIAAVATFTIAASASLYFWKKPDDPYVKDLLMTAAIHESVGHRCEPPGSNAYEAYQAVLSKSPNHPVAREAVVRLDCPDSNF
jgi:hypothetical protein